MTKIPLLIDVPKPTDKLGTPNKCKTCAYRIPSTKDDDDMTKMYYAEWPRPHPCHERKDGWVCKGALETFKRLGLKPIMA